MLDLTGIRIGTESSLRENGSYGLTTLRRKHVDFGGEGARLRFRGKGGQAQEVGLSDGRLAGILQECYQAPGYELFQVRDEDGDRHLIGSEDVNEYIQAVSGEEFTARDFRTWVGSIQALEAIDCLPPAQEETERQDRWQEVLAVVSQTLHNTPAVCEEFYIHPQIAQAFQSGRFICKPERKATPRVRDLRRTEALFLALLEENEPDSGG
jgi:DNA topoisomerase I